MKNKIFVITDERCGGTELANLFTILGYNIIDDPQTFKEGRDLQKNNKEFVLNNIDYFFENYDYIKICMVSYTFDEYLSILKKVISLNQEIKIIFLWRRNFLERGLSKAIAIETGVWTKKDYNKMYKGNFKININKLIDIVDDNKKKITSMNKFLNDNGIKYYPLLYENIYGRDLNGDQRMERFNKLLKYIQPELISNISVNQYSILVERLCPCKKVNDVKTYNRIINIGEIITKLSNNENGILKLK